jgi:hypothetical protein
MELFIAILKSEVTDEFLEYLDGLTARMNPYLGPCSVLVIDNCCIHHIEGVEKLCAAQ